MGDIPSNELKRFELNQTEQLKKALISSLRDNKKTKQVILYTLKNKKETL